jgi:Ca-activated chloride channel family protein
MDSMDRSWISCVVAVLAWLSVLTGISAAQSGSDLPAAPSAVIQQKNAPPPAPAPAPQAKPVDPAPAGTSNASEKTDGQQPSDEKASVSPPADNTSEVASSRPTITKEVNVVSVVLTVTDKHNRYVKDLKVGDFKVIDDEKPVENLRVHHESDLPLQVGLLIDASGSIRERFKFEQESATEFLNETIRPRFDKAFVLGFDSSLEITQDFTDSTERLSKGIRSLRPGNATRLYDAIYYACREKLLQSAQSDSVRRAIVLVSDGDDNASHATREEAIEMALRADVIIYTISTNYAGMGNTDKNDKILERIADATGGRTFRPFQPQDVANAFAQIQDDLRSQYALSYRPADFAHDGRYRTIDILAAHKGLKVRSRHGYYAPAE